MRAKSTGSLPSIVPLRLLVMSVDAGGGVSSWCCEELGSSVVDDVLRVLFFFPLPLIDFFFLQQQ